MGSEPAPLAYFDRPWTRRFKPWPHALDLRAVGSAVRWLQAQPRWDNLSSSEHAMLLETCDPPRLAQPSEVPLTPSAFGKVSEHRIYGA